MSHDLTSFDEQVISRSHKVPVLVDFWADWCGPCLMFGPILERVVAAAEGRWELVKVNTEAEPDLAQRYGVRSLPTLKLFVGGEPIAESLGALSEPALKHWVGQHLPSPFAAALDAAENDLKNGEFARAEATSDSVLSAEPANDRALFLKSLSSLNLAPGTVASTANAIPTDSPYFAKVAPLRELAKMLLDPPSEPGKGAEFCAEAVSAVRRLDWNAACEAFLILLERDRHYGHDLASKALKQTFLLLGPRHEVTERHQRRFASLLFS